MYALNYTTTQDFTQNFLKSKGYLKNDMDGKKINIQRIFFVLLLISKAKELFSFCTAPTIPLVLKS